MLLRGCTECCCKGLLCRYALNVVVGVQDDGCFYICGDAASMATQVNQTLIDIFKTTGESNAAPMLMLSLRW